jgi:hypothetical protein
MFRLAQRTPTNRQFPAYIPFCLRMQLAWCAKEKIDRRATHMRISICTTSSTIWMLCNLFKVSADNAFTMCSKWHTSRSGKQTIVQCKHKYKIKYNCTCLLNSISICSTTQLYYMCNIYLHKVIIFVLFMAYKIDTLTFDWQFFKT